MNNYDVSVIIPNYNKEKFLNRCIMSVVEQTYKNIEIIVIDDCSTDNSYSILSELSKKIPNIHISKNEKNSGVSFSRNRGIELAKTNYITFLDSDDFYFNPKKIENEMNLIIEYKTKFNKEIVSYSKVVGISNDEKVVTYPQFKKYLTGHIFEKLIVGKNFETIMRDYCFNKDILSKSGLYNVNSNYYEDLDLLIRISKFYDFYCTDEYGTGYRDSINGLSKKSRLQSYKARIEIYKTYINEFGFFKKICLNFKMYFLIFVDIIKVIFNKIFK